MKSLIVLVSLYGLTRILKIPFHRKKAFNDRYKKRRIRYLRRQLKKWESYKNTFCKPQYDGDVEAVLNEMDYWKNVRRINNKINWYNR